MQLDVVDDRAQGDVPQQRGVAGDDVHDLVRGDDGLADLDA